MKQKKYRYLLVSKVSNNWFNTELFYTLEEARLVAENIFNSETTIIDLENENIKWQGCE